MASSIASGSGSGSASGSDEGYLSGSVRSGSPEGSDAGSISGSENGSAEEQLDDDDEKVTFESLGIIPQICDTCTSLNFKNPTSIQREAIPHALAGKDIIGLAQTGSGKTAAFAIPILQSLWDAPAPFFALVLAPTRELAYQIAQTFTTLGSPLGVRVAVLVGGMDMMTQSVALSKRPHIVVATPGRLMDHLENTKGFSLRKLNYLVRATLTLRLNRPY